MVLPGIQALFGFQLIAVFSESFEKKLSGGEQRLHLAAIVLAAVAAALVMAPAAIHRWTQQRAVSERFIWISSQLLFAGMLPLAAALSLDIYLIGRDDSRGDRARARRSPRSSWRWCWSCGSRLPWASEASRADPASPIIGAWRAGRLWF